VGEGSTNTPQGVGHGGGKEALHVPVLLKEAIDFLNVRRGGTYIDATVGLGGHSYEIAKRLGAAGHLIGLDKDPKALEIAREKLAVGLSSFVLRNILSLNTPIRPRPCSNHSDREKRQERDRISND
jgi:tRNA A58 N-methylase Trm61